MPVGDSHSDEVLRPGAGDAAPSEEVDRLFEQTEAVLAALVHPTHDIGPSARAFEFPDFAARSTGAPVVPPADDGQAELDVTIELGRAELSREEMLGLRAGAVVPLDKLAGEPAEVLVNGRLFARGEVVVLDDKFCVRVTELVAATAQAGCE